MSSITVNRDLVSFINVFTVEPTKQQALIDRLKLHAETLVSKQPGFISAKGYCSLDRTRVVNYVHWTSVEASKAIHKNPDISAAFTSYQELDVSMDLRYYEVASLRKQPTIIQADSNYITQINLLHVVSENQQLLLEKLTQIIDPVISCAMGNLSTVWLRSLDGIRIVSYSQWSNQDSYDAAFVNLDWAAGANLIEQVDSHLYQLNFVVDARDSNKEQAVE